jgi:hypothetical protein
VVGQVHSRKLRAVVISHSFAFSASRRLKFSYKSILPCTAFPSTLVSILELSPPLPVLLLLRVGGLSRLNTRAVRLDLGLRVLADMSLKRKEALLMRPYCTVIPVIKTLER